MRFLTIALAANDVKSFDVAGGYFEIIDSAGKINVAFTDVAGSAMADNALTDALSGTFATGKFSRFDITERTGIAQTVTIMYGPSSGGTRRQPGVVQVVDGGKARTLAGQAFKAYASAGATVNTSKAQVQLLNPVGSGKRVVVKRIMISSALAGYVNLASYGTALNSGGPYLLSSKFLDASAPGFSARLYRQTDNAAFLGTQIESHGVLANQPMPFPLEEPIVIGPGNGIVAGAPSDATLGSGIQVTFEGFEESLT